MAKENMFDSIFEKNEPEAQTEAIPEKAVQTEETSVSAKSDSLFCLKDISEKERKPTTIIFSKRNLAFLKKMAIDENLNMSEVVNRWLEGLQAEG